jgi:hypothetical protein
MSAVEGGIEGILQSSRHTTPESLLNAALEGASKGLRRITKRVLYVDALLFRVLVQVVSVGTDPHCTCGHTYSYM